MRIEAQVQVDLELSLTGYRLLDKEKTSVYDNNIYGGDLGIAGWPIVFGNYMLLSERVTGNIAIFDVSEITSPKMLAKYTSNTSPDIACVYEDKAYIPLGNYGIMVIDLK